MGKLQKDIEKEKRQLLQTMKKLQNATAKEWPTALSWFNCKGNVDQTRINKRLQQLVADSLVIQIGHRYLVK